MPIAGRRSPRGPTCSSRRRGRGPTTGIRCTAGDRAATGSLAPAVPGAIAGFCEAQAHYGRLTLEQVLVPAIEAAESGVAFTYSDRLGILDRVPDADLGEETLAVLMPGGRFPRGGAEAQSDRFDTRALARTLRLISRKGPGGFYRGRVAAAIEGRLRGAGGVLGRDDLAAYRTRTLDEPPAALSEPRVRVLLRPGRLRGPEHSGALRYLAGYGQDSFQYRHLVAEALALAFTDSMAHYGDPDFVASPVGGLSSPAFAAVRAKLIRMRRALPRPVTPGDPWPFDPQQSRCGAPGRPLRDTRSETRDEPGRERGSPWQHGELLHFHRFVLRVARVRAGSRLLPQQRNAELRSSIRNGPIRSLRARCRSSPLLRWWRPVAGGESLRQAVPAATGSRPACCTLSSTVWTTACACRRRWTTRACTVRARRRSSTPEFRSRYDIVCVTPDTN